MCVATAIDDVLSDLSDEYDRLDKILEALTAHSAVRTATNSIACCNQLDQKALGKKTRGRVGRRNTRSWLLALK
jgi:hypothetical protein